MATSETTPLTQLPPYQQMVVIPLNRDEYHNSSELQAQVQEDVRRGAIYILTTPDNPYREHFLRTERMYLFGMAPYSHCLVIRCLHSTSDIYPVPGIYEVPEVPPRHSCCDCCIL